MKISLPFFENLVGMIRLLYDTTKNEKTLSKDDSDFIEAVLLQCQTLILEEKGVQKFKAIMERFPIEEFILKVDTTYDNDPTIILELDENINETT
jgi:hypothetical protein